MKLRHKKSNQDAKSWRLRYGGKSKNYRKMCKLAHQKTHYICCVCISRRSTQIHHAYYGDDIIGQSIFPVCNHCHCYICHNKTNWIRDVDNPVWKNRNTENFVQKLRAGYESVVGAIAQNIEFKNKIKLYCQITSIRLKLVITLKEAAIISGLPKEFLKNQINAGNLNAKKIGKEWMTRPTDVDTLLNILFISPPKVDIKELINFLSSPMSTSIIFADVRKAILILKLVFNLQESSELDTTQQVQ